MANATENNRETKPPQHTRERERKREREGATQIDVHFVTTEQGIQYTFGSTLAESKFRSHELWLLRQGARNAAATEHSDVCQPGVHKY